MAERLVKTGCLVILSLTIVVGLACPALAQSSTSERLTDGSSTRSALHDLILVNFILDHERELKLSSQQVQILESIRSEFQKQALKKRANLQVIELELDELRAKTPVDLAAVETKVKQSEALKTELRIDSIKAVEATKAKLSPEQRTRLEALQKANPVSAGLEDSTDANLQQQVQSILKEQYKDQKVVELETSEAIVTKLMDWAKTFGLVIGVPLTILGLALGILGIKTLADITKLAETAKQNFAKTIEEGKQDLTKTITTGNQGIANTVSAANEAMVKLVSTGQQEVERKLSEAEQTLKTLKTKGDSYLADYKNIEAQVTEITALAKKVPTITRNLEALASKVDQIEEQINVDSSNISTAQKSEIISKLESFQKYFQGIGFTPPKGKIKVKVDIRDRSNAFYDMKRNLLQIGLLLIDDLDMTLHSYAHHALMGVKKQAWDSPLLGVVSLEAGLADYFTCSFTNNPLLGEKSIDVFRVQAGEGRFPHPYLRNLDNNRSFDEVDPKDPQTTEPHNVGEIWGGVFWKLRSLLGQEAADKLIFSTWTATDIATGFGLKFVKKLLDLYQSTGDEKNGNRIKSIFKQRGLKL
jgi:Spy/CpxP family protein refolding chaperone